MSTHMLAFKSPQTHSLGNKKTVIKIKWDEIYFVKKGRKVSREDYFGSAKIGRQGNFFGDYSKNTDVIEAQKFFNKKHKAQRIYLWKYIRNLKSIKEEYVIVEYPGCTAVECVSLKEDLDENTKLYIDAVLEEFQEFADELKGVE